MNYLKTCSFAINQTNIFTNCSLFYRHNYLFKAFSNVSKKKNVKYDVALIMPEKSKKNLEEYKFQEVELKKLTSIADSTIKFLKRINDDLAFLDSKYRYIVEMLIKCEVGSTNP